MLGVISRRRLLALSAAVLCGASGRAGAGDAEPEGEGRRGEPQPGEPHPGEPQPSWAGEGAKGQTRPARRLVVGQYITYYDTDSEHRDRARNLALTADAIHGVGLGPGETFSFNSVVGERTSAFGFQKSPVLRDGLLTEGTGGGACQIASTLHAAALLSGFVIVQRQPHSRPSAYIPMTLDATVVFPSVDLRFKNPWPYRTEIRARAARGEVRIAFVADTGTVGSLGLGTKPRTSVTIEVLERTAFARKIERDESLSQGTVLVKAFGIPGFRVRRIREREGGDGGVVRDFRIDTYPPTQEIVAVSSGFDATVFDGMRELRAGLRSKIEGQAAPPLKLEMAKGVHPPTAEQLRPRKQIVVSQA